MTGSVATASAGTVSYADGESLALTTTGQFLTAVKPGMRQFDIRPVYSPGEDGGGTQNFGERSQTFSLEVIYSGASDQAVQTAIWSDLEIMAHVSTVTIGSQAFSGCMLQESEFEQAKRNGYPGGGVYTKGRLKFLSVRP